MTVDERVVLLPVNNHVFQSCSDVPDGGIEAPAHGLEEAYGEKVCDLAERTRPRDLYGVVKPCRNWEARPSPAMLLDVPRGKCEFKGIAVPRASDLDEHKADLERHAGTSAPEPPAIRFVPECAARIF